MQRSVRRRVNPPRPQEPATPGHARVPDHAHRAACVPPAAEQPSVDAPKDDHRPQTEGACLAKLTTARSIRRRGSSRRCLVVAAGLFSCTPRHCAQSLLRHAAADNSLQGLLLLLLGGAERSREEGRRHMGSRYQKARRSLRSSPMAGSHGCPSRRRPGNHTVEHGHRRFRHGNAVKTRGKAVRGHGTAVGGQGKAVGGQ